MWAGIPYSELSTLQARTHTHTHTHTRARARAQIETYRKVLLCDLLIRLLVRVVLELAHTLACAYIGSLMRRYTDMNDRATAT